MNRKLLFAFLAGSAFAGGLILVGNSMISDIAGSEDVDSYNEPQPNADSNLTLSPDSHVFDNFEDKYVPKPMGDVEITQEQMDAYGDRAPIIAYMENTWGYKGPELNWRDSLADWLHDENPKWSQKFEELVMRDFFQDRKGGFYLDIGCYLPRELSTTYYLEHELSWRGIGVDVQEGYGKAWKKYRPESKFFAYAVADTDGQKLKFNVMGTIASIGKERMENLLESADIKPQFVEKEFTTITLNTLLEQEGVERVDLLHMDVEGAELLVLAGFDIQRYKPELCSVAQDSGKPDEIRAYFEANGYRQIEKYLPVEHADLYFAPKTHRVFQNP